MRKKILTSLAYATFLLLITERCAYNDSNIPDPCPTTNLAVVLENTKDATGCAAVDGEITVSGTGGLPPYTFSINGGEYKLDPTFHVSAGTYQIRVKDLNNCWRKKDVTVGADGSDLKASAVATEDSQCLSNDGTITVTATGGEAPYLYQLDAKGFVSGNLFSNVSEEGVHVAMIRDANDCQTTLSVDVPRGATGISYAGTIKTIFTASCTGDVGCHVHTAGSGALDWTKFENVKDYAASIRLRTTNRSMPLNDSLTQVQIRQIQCWVDDGALEN